MRLSLDIFKNIGQIGFLSAGLLFSSPEVQAQENSVKNEVQKITQIEKDTIIDTFDEVKEVFRSKDLSSIKQLFKENPDFELLPRNTFNSLFSLTDIADSFRKQHGIHLNFNENSFGGEVYSNFDLLEFVRTFKHHSDQIDPNLFSKISGNVDNFYLSKPIVNNNEDSLGGLFQPINKYIFSSNNDSRTFFHEIFHALKYSLTSGDFIDNAWMEILLIDSADYVGNDFKNMEPSDLYISSYMRSSAEENQAEYSKFNFPLSYGDKFISKSQENYSPEALKALNLIKLFYFIISDGLMGPQYWEDLYNDLVDKNYWKTKQAEVLNIKNLSKDEIKFKQAIDAGMSRKNAENLKQEIFDVLFKDPSIKNYEDVIFKLKKLKSFDKEYFKQEFGNDYLKLIRKNMHLFKKNS